MLTVLIADDAAASRELICAVLEGAGYRVIEAQDGAEALRRAEALRPDLIILDIQMPLLDGYATLRALRSDPAFHATPVIALTAGAMRGERERALEAGFALFVVKPVSIAHLRAEVNRLLTRGAAQAAD